MTIHRDVIKLDVDKCIKKHWYLGLDIELRRVIRLLQTDGGLPGQYPMRGFSGDYAGKILHARILLPNTNYGKSKGPRIVYFSPENNPERIKVVYVGGHKDRVYETDKFILIVLQRLQDSEEKLIKTEDYLAK